jgi:hypothetical protein
MVQLKSDIECELKFKNKIKTSKDDIENKISKNCATTTQKSANGYTGH